MSAAQPIEAVSTRLCAVLEAEERLYVEFRALLQRERECMELLRAYVAASRAPGDAQAVGLGWKLQRGKVSPEKAAKMFRQAVEDLEPGADGKSVALRADCVRAMLVEYAQVTLAHARRDRPAA